MIEFDDRLPFARGQVGQTLRIYTQNAFAKIDFWDTDLHTSPRFQPKSMKKGKEFKKGAGRGGRKSDIDSDCKF